MDPRYQAKRPDDGYRVPEGYFDDLADRVLERARPDRRRRLGPWLARAAAILVLLAGGLWWLTRPAEAPEPALAELSEEALFAYLEREAEQLDPDDLVEVLALGATPSDQLDYALPTLDNLTESDVLDYLLRAPEALDDPQLELDALPTLDSLN